MDTTNRDGKTCETCLYVCGWKWNLPIAGTVSGLECRRRPPIVPGSDLVAFPRVQADWWCGEYEPREKEPVCTCTVLGNAHHVMCPVIVAETKKRALEQ